MKTALGLAAAAAAAAGVVMFGLAAPAQAQSSWSFGLSIGNGGYYPAPYYSRYDPFYRPYYRSRRVWRDPAFYNPYPYYAPPVYVAPPPVVVYERRDRYDPLPRWREAVPPAYGYGYGGGYSQYGQYGYQQDYGAGAVTQQPYAYAQSSGAPATTQSGAVRYDLVQQGYSPDELQSYRESLDRYGYQPYSAYGPGGAAESYIRGGSANPDDALLGGPR